MIRKDHFRKCAVSNFTEADEHQLVKVHSNLKWKIPELVFTEKMNVALFLLYCRFNQCNNAKPITNTSLCKRVGSIVGQYPVGIDVSAASLRRQVAAG